MDDFEQYVKVLLHELSQEGAILISPRPGEFNRFEGSFLEGLRRVPAVLETPPGVGDPFKHALGHPGRWIMMWLPDKRMR